MIGAASIIAAVTITGLDSPRLVLAAIPFVRQLTGALGAAVDMESASAGSCLPFLLPATRPSGHNFRSQRCPTGGSSPLAIPHLLRGVDSETMTILPATAAEIRPGGRGDVSPFARILESLPQASRENTAYMRYDEAALSCSRTSAPALLLTPLAGRPSWHARSEVRAAPDQRFASRPTGQGRP
jgi:hypothetical protein